MLKGKLKFDIGFIERLFKSKAPPLIGCDISTSAVKLVEIVETSKGLYRIERYVIEPLPRDAVVDGNIINLDAVSDGMKRQEYRPGTAYRGSHHKKNHRPRRTKRQ
jgi:type IV pilus assembly protein PilM